jgi:hypothetical protein
MTKPKTRKSASASKALAPKPAAKSETKPEKKADTLVAMLRRDSGAALTEITGATGWLPHSARAMLTGLRKKGFTLDKTRVDGVTRYAITAEPVA